MPDSRNEEWAERDRPRVREVRAQSRESERQQMRGYVEKARIAERDAWNALSTAMALHAKAVDRLRATEEELAKRLTQDRDADTAFHAESADAR